MANLKDAFIVRTLPERRLLVEITYDLEKNQKEYFKNLQLNLFNNENHR